MNRSADAKPASLPAADGENPGDSPAPVPELRTPENRPAIADDADLADLAERLAADRPSGRADDGGGTYVPL